LAGWAAAEPLANANATSEQLVTKFSKYFFDTCMLDSIRGCEFCLEFLIPNTGMSWLGIHPRTIAKIKTQ
jgi:hypothetical protein